jgi:hypothetical protein
VQLTVADDAISEYTFTDTSSGSPKLKAFCRTCGCPLWTVPSAAKGKFLLIRTTLLEDGYVFPSDMLVHLESAVLTDTKLVHQATE